jgi:hypothetical protein
MLKARRVKGIRQESPNVFPTQVPNSNLRDRHIATAGLTRQLRECVLNEAVITFTVCIIRDDHKQGRAVGEIGNNIRQNLQGRFVREVQIVEHQNDWYPKR